MYTPSAILQDGGEKFSGLRCSQARMRGRLMLPMLAVDWQASAVRDEEVGHFREVAGICRLSLRAGPQRTLLTVDSKVA